MSLAHDTIRKGSGAQAGWEVYLVKAEPVPKGYAVEGYLREVEDQDVWWRFDSVLEIKGDRVAVSTLRVKPRRDITWGSEVEYAKVILERGGQKLFRTLMSLFPVEIPDYQGELPVRVLSGQPAESLARRDLKGIPFPYKGPTAAVTAPVSTPEKAEADAKTDDSWTDRLVRKTIALIYWSDAQQWSAVYQRDHSPM